MRWSVGVEAEGDRVLPRRRSSSWPTLSPPATASRPASARAGTARSSSSRRTAATRRSARRPSSSSRRPRRRGLPAAPVVRTEAVSEDEEDDLTVIRLGSLAGYPFEGPRLLGGWTPPAVGRRVRDRLQAGPGNQARAATPSSTSGTRDDLSAERFPFQHPAGALLGAAGRVEMEDLRLHLRGAGRVEAAP